LIVVSINAKAVNYDALKQKINLTDHELLEKIEQLNASLQVVNNWSSILPVVFNAIVNTSTTSVDEVKKKRNLDSEARKYSNYKKKFPYIKCKNEI
jgi:hypothetical protein